MSSCFNTWHACVTNFWELGGRKKRVVVVGDHPDARCANFLFKTNDYIYRSAPWTRKFKRGYIEFRKSRKYDIAQGTIDGKQVYIFYCSPEIEAIYIRQSLLRLVSAWHEEASGPDRLALDVLVRESAYPELGAGCPVHVLLGTLSLRQLEDLADLVAVPPHDGRAGGTPHPQAAAPVCLKEKRNVTRLRIRPIDLLVSRNLEGMQAVNRAAVDGYPPGQSTLTEMGSLQREAQSLGFNLDHETARQVEADSNANG